MKNIYELSTKEIDNYCDEFNKLESTKKINRSRFSSLLLALIFGIATVFLGAFSEDRYKNLDDYASYTLTLAIICLVIFIFYEVYSRISFTRWLKIKHNIEY